MDDRQLIEDLLSALEYHIEQTRPIQFSTVAIEAAREHLRKPAQRKPLTDDEIWREYRFLWPFHPAEERKLASDILMFARAIEAAHGIKENT